MSSEGEPDLTCQQCGKNKATVHLTEFVDGKSVQKHFCEECYGKQQDAPPLSTSGVFSQILEVLAPELARLGKWQCPDCGINYLEFHRALMLGCPKDYDVFAESLDGLLERMHGATRHVGKTPRGAAQRNVRSARLEVLRREMEEAVRREDFEKAAAVRDEIKELERDSAGTPDQ